MKTYKKGISLIVLVITVLVLAILATTVIVSLSNTNIITEANEAVIKSRFKSMQEQLTLYVADQYAVTNGAFKLADLDAEAKSATIDEIFPELKGTKYYDYVSLLDGNIVLAKNMPDREIALEVISEYEEPDVITNYTQADIDASNGNIVAIGATNALDVVGVVSEDGKTFTITKNSVTSDGKIRDNEMGPEGSVLIPSTVTNIIFEKGITEVGSQSFVANENIYSVSFPDGLLRIGDNAFNSCFNLTTINSLPDGLTILEEAVFGSSTSLSGDIVIPNSVTEIGPYCFASTSILSVTLPDGSLKISPHAFFDCTSLTSVTFENTSGWYVAEASSATSGTDISSTDLSNASTAATYLTSTYEGLYWLKK